MGIGKERANLFEKIDKKKAAGWGLLVFGAAVVTSAPLVAIFSFFGGYQLLKKDKSSR